jgi:hypothetical protein
VDNLTEKRMYLSEDLIDRMINIEGVHYTIRYLVAFGFTEDELVEMLFDRETIMEALVLGGEFDE